jgi:hypothetical protein
VLVGNSTPATAALLQETRTIPIVFVGVSDPVGSHFVASIARPGGGATGFTNLAPSMVGKWLEMLKQVTPAITRAAVIFNPQTAPGGGSFFLEPFEAAARSFAVEPIAARSKDADDSARAVAAMAREPGGSLVIMPDAFTTVHRQLIILLSTRYALPAVYPYRYQAMDERGGRCRRLAHPIFGFCVEEALGNRRLNEKVAGDRLRFPAQSFARARSDSFPLHRGRRPYMTHNVTSTNKLQICCDAQRISAT